MMFTALGATLMMAILPAVVGFGLASSTSQLQITPSAAAIARTASSVSASAAVLSDR